MQIWKCFCVLYVNSILKEMKQWRTLVVILQINSDVKKKNHRTSKLVSSQKFFGNIPENFGAQ